jgi:Concanavalin A-like lectin/glucanases superfamily
MKLFQNLCIPIFFIFLHFLTGCKDHSDQDSSTLNNGLIGYYNFNNNVTDQSGKGNDGALFGGYYSNELDGNGTYNFNGNGDYIKVNNSPSLNPSDAISISLWFKPVDFYGSGYDALVLKPFTSHVAPYYQYILGLEGSHGLCNYNFAFSVNVNGVNTGIHSEVNTWTQGNWYHVVGIYDGLTLKLFVNGTLKVSLPAAGSITSYDTDLFFAKQSNIGSTTPGTLDNVRIYNRAISEKEVMELYREDFK